MTIDAAGLAVGLVSAAASLCEEARGHDFDGDAPAARLAYLEAERLLLRADRLRGVDRGPVVLEARVDLERRMGIWN